MSPQLPRFGTLDSACVVPCSHSYCRMIMMIASAPCARCGQRIGSGEPFEETLDGRLFHAQCPTET